MQCSGNIKVMENLVSGAIAAPAARGSCRLMQGLDRSVATKGSHQQFLPHAKGSGVACHVSTWHMLHSLPRRVQSPAEADLVHLTACSKKHAEGHSRTGNMRTVPSAWPTPSCRRGCPGVLSAS